MQITDVVNQYGVVDGGNKKHLSLEHNELVRKASNGLR